MSDDEPTVEEMLAHVEAIGSITAIKAAVVTMLIGIYRERGREALEDTLTLMHEHPQVSAGIVPVAVELVVALSGCVSEKGL